MLTRLVSIDTTRGTLRSYAATAGGTAKLQARVDLLGYEDAIARGDGYAFDRDRIEEFRTEPQRFLAPADTPPAVA